MTGTTTRTLGFGLLVLMAACGDPVLKGPNYPAEKPPWVAPGLSTPDPGFEVRHRVLLIGDAGYYLDDDPVLAALSNWADSSPASSVVFLGDNIYDDGLIEEERESAEQILAQQLAATDRFKVVIPGNHDWGMNPEEQNLQAILNQQEFVDAWPGGSARYEPRDGCMGPIALTLQEAVADFPAVVLLVTDPTPFLLPRLRELCPGDAGDEGYFRSMDSLLEQHGQDIVLVASHYPMITGGPHGGLSYGVMIDAIVNVLGWLYGGLLNTYEPLYAEWIERTREVFRRNPPAVYAAGHDHSLQVITGDDSVGAYVVSGAGAIERVSTVTSIERTLFAHAAPGFVVADLGVRDGRPAMLLRVVEAGADEPVFEYELSLVRS